MTSVHRAGGVVVALGCGLAAAGTLHLAYNLRVLRVPPSDPLPVGEAVSVLLPVRDEAHRVGPCVRALLAQERVPDLEVVVLDDGSRDGTPDVVRAGAGADPRLRLVRGAPPPAGWLGKPYACAQLAAYARGSVLVFVDADVVLEPLAVAAAVTLLRTSGLDLVSPYPRQVAGSLAERLVQPLLQWSWLTTVPLRVAERSRRPSLAVANGQFLVVDGRAYARAGGHHAVRDEVLDDVALLRALERAGGRGVVVDGTGLGSCRMYEGWRELREGYAKSLWSAFGTPAGAAAVVGGLALAYVAPAVAALRGSPVGLAGYLAAVAGRALAARRTGARAWPDALAHPLSVALVGWLTADSWRRRRSGTLAWKGRRLG